MRVFVSVIVLSLTSASDTFNVNEKPELARGHGLQNRAWEKRLHITRESTLSKSIWEAGSDIYVCDSHILQWGRVDRVVLDIFSGDAWLNNLIRLTWQAKMKRCLPALRPLTCKLKVIIWYTEINLAPESHLWNLHRYHNKQHTRSAGVSQVLYLTAIVRYLYFISMFPFSAK